MLAEYIGLLILLTASVTFMICAGANAHYSKYRAEKRKKHPSGATAQGTSAARFSSRRLIRAT